ncbi:MAG: hypothetical protein ACTHMS_05620 [Jatrophihabitans sp.]|uniref:hypothetical protein n=1 Tax=Jatrophihabitans sp. TaxID=1932789 RepID=UPI003F7E0DB2
MRPRHGQRSTTPRPGLRWLAGAVGVGLAGAAVLAGSPAGAASGDDVTAVFSVTGVSTSNCSVSTGGADVYIKPGAELDAKVSAVGITLLGLPIATSGLALFDGTLTIDPKSQHPIVEKLDDSSVAKINGLSSGNHSFTFEGSVTPVNALLTNLSTLKLLGAGAALDYAGTIHVTNDAPNCGVAVQVPGPSVSVSVTGLPPIQVSVPPVNVSVPVDPGQVLSNLPLPGKTPAPGKTTTPSKFTYTPPAPSVPEQVVPSGTNIVLPGTTGGGYFGGSTAAGAPVGQATTPTTSTAPSASASAKPVDKADIAKAKHQDLASAKAPSAQLPVVLAILAVIALAVVTATYARLYLLRRSQ